MRGRCSEPSRNIFVRAVAFVACFSVCVSGLLLAPNTGWAGSEPQVVLAAGGSSGGGGADTESEWDSLVKRVSAIADQVSRLADLISSLQSQMSSINGSLSNIYNSLSSLYDKNASQDKAFVDVYNNLSDLRGKIQNHDSVFKDLYLHVNDLTQKNVDQDGALQNAFLKLNDVWQKNVDQDVALQNAFLKLNDVWQKNVDQDKAFVDVYNNLSDLRGKIQNHDSVFKDLYLHVNDLTQKNVDQDSALSTLYQRSDKADQKDVDQDKALSDVFGQLTSIHDKDASQDVAFTGLFTRVSSLESDFVGLSAVVHSVDVVRDKLDVVSDWLSKIYSFFFDTFWPLFRDLHTLIDNSVMQILDKVTGIDNKFAGFWSDFKDFRDVTSGFYLNFGKVMADFQKGVFSGLIAVSEWLKAIYYSIQNLPAPETSEIHLPPNDGGGGGSGTNIWDVLKQLIESLGTIVGKLVDALSKLADLVSQLFVPKDLSFISDTFDGISSKFDKKFAIFIDFGSSLKGLFSSRHVLKDFSLSFAGSSVVVPLSVVSTLAGQIRPLLTGLFVLLTVIGVYRRFTDGEVVS